MPQNIQHLVVDSGAFIKNAAVHEYAENVYSVNGIVNEIRDKATRQRLQFLPYTLNLKDPEVDCIKYVTEFSKKTGDYLNLSAVDLKIIALAYQLEKEHVGIDHLKKEPACEVTGRRPESQKQLLGFYNPRDDENEDSSKNFSLHNFSSEDQIPTEAMTNQENDNVLTMDSEVMIKNNSDNDFQKDENGEVDYNISEEHVANNEEYDSNNLISDNITGKNNEENNDDDENYEECGDDDDNESWITPNNIFEVQKKMGNVTFDSDSDATVACITTDFAIQNVLHQMGLKVLSVDGMLIKKAKVFILRCFSCYKTTTIMTSNFCKNCGNKTLKRVSVSLKEDGSKTIHINFKRPINVRGTKYSLPKPQGGKHGQNPHLCADQPFPHNRMPKSALKKIDVLGPDFCAASESPFSTHDLNSRATTVRVHGHSQYYHRRNPNECSKRTFYFLCCFIIMKDPNKNPEYQSY